MQTIYTFSLKQAVVIGGICFAAGLLAGALVYTTIFAHYLGII